MTDQPDRAAEAEARRNIGKGPFRVATPKDPLYLDTFALVLDAAGNPFANVDPEDCAGGDLTAAKARATRIAEALNGAFRGEERLPIEQFEERAHVHIGQHFVWPRT